MPPFETTVPIGTIESAVLFHMAQAIKCGAHWNNCREKYNFLAWLIVDKYWYILFH